MSEGRYAVFRYAGEVKGIQEAHRSIDSCWFRDSSLAPEDFNAWSHVRTDAVRELDVPDAARWGSPGFATSISTR
ncbi:hypothetical protein [Sorangium sp. So ce1000]|uniref:hypothetical protein n=1 Tax=Sorangium sp. So ce1000 TaxID=3133325 RepID=UPI003F639BDD